MSMSESESNGTVSYSVKELLARQDGKLDSILLTINAKADKADVDGLAGRVTAVENMQAQQKGTSNFARWAVPVFLSLLALATAVIGLLR